MNKIQIGTDGIATTTLQIGFEGENVHTQVVIYWTTLYSKYPDAVASMVIRPASGNPYPKAITQEDNKVIWDVSASDTVYPGNGEYQLTFTNGEEIIKTYIGRFSIQSSIIGNGEAPTPIEDWIEQAGEALGELESLSASATTLPAGSQATAEMTTVGGHKNIAIGVPKGASVEDVTVTGATPSITGEANKRYLCGTVTSLSVTPPQTGMIDVLFTSGSTATTLTLPNTVKMPDDYIIDKNRVYELNILDGYGVIVSWTTA